MDPIVLNLRVGRLPAAAAPGPGELSAEEVDGNFSALLTGLLQAYAESLKVADASPLTALPLPVLGSDQVVVFRDGVGYLAPATAFGVANSAPGAFTAPQWTVEPIVGGLRFNIAALPPDGGSAITALQYRLSSGDAPVSFTGTGTGVRDITGLAATSRDTQIRAVNAIGAGPWSDVKTRTPTGASLTSTYIGIADRTGVGSFPAFTNPAPAAGQRLIVVFSGEVQAPGDVTITVNGGSTITPLQILTPASDNMMAVFETAAPAGSSITIAFATTATVVAVVSCAVYVVSGGTVRSSAIIRGASPQSVSVDVAAGGLVVAGVSSVWYNNPTLAFTAGATSDGSNANGLRVGSAQGLSANASYTVSGTSSAGQPAVAAVSMQP